MARRLFYPKEEILSKDFNALRNDYEKLLLERFLSKAIPRIPAFIGGGFKPSLAGNQVNVAPGIGIQRIAQNDGSSEIRLIALDTEQTMSFSVANPGLEKVDLIQARSVITPDPTEDRTFKVGAGEEERATTISNRWSAEVAVKAGVVPDAQGNYRADSGWVPVAVVTLNDTGITELTDIRDFYNLFDPDFFSVYGRKNISFTRQYEGVNLIEVPFEFSDLVPKLDQISIRRITRGLFGRTSFSEKYDADFTLADPVAPQPTVNRQKRFLGHNSLEVTLNLHGLYRTYRYSRDIGYFYFLYKYNTKWVDGPFGEQDIWGFTVQTSSVGSR